MWDTATVPSQSFCTTSRDFQLVGQDDVEYNRCIADLVFRGSQHWRAMTLSRRAFLQEFTSQPPHLTFIMKRTNDKRAALNDKPTFDHNHPHPPFLIRLPNNSRHFCAETLLSRHALTVSILPSSSHLAHGMFR